MLVRALAQAVLFQRAHLPRRAPLVPLSTMTSALALYKKIAADPGPTIGSVLEVGPGCGYLSYYLASNPLLQDYSQVEACESFYILQSMINSHLLGHQFRDFAIDCGAPDRTLRVRKDVELPCWSRKRGLPKHNCHHFRGGPCATVLDRKYDVVTSNANLSEFSSEALRDYLTIFLEGDEGRRGVRGAVHRIPRPSTLEQLFDTLHEFRLAPMLCALAHEVVYARHVCPELHAHLHVAGVRPPRVRTQHHSPGEGDAPAVLPGLGAGATLSPWLRRRIQAAGGDVPVQRTGRGARPARRCSSAGQDRAGQGGWAGR